ncbi:hypothetical protein AVEN_202051-1, partial [Araneus ventricosus]
PRWLSGKVSALEAGGFQVRNPIPLKIRRVWGLLHVKSYLMAKCPPVAVAWKFGKGVPAQFPRINLSRATPSLPWCPGHLKNDRRSNYDTEVRVLTAITGSSSMRYISSSVRGNSTPSITLPKSRSGKPLTYAGASHPPTHGASR